MAEKLTRLVPVKLAESTHAKLLKVCGGLRQRAGWIRLRIEEGIQRAAEEKRNGRVTREEARALLEARAMGIDPVAALRAQIAEKLSPLNTP